MPQALANDEPDRCKITVNIKLKTEAKISLKPLKRLYFRPLCDTVSYKISASKGAASHVQSKRREPPARLGKPADMDERNIGKDAYGLVG
jgi:hypothetical protein